MNEDYTRPLQLAEELTPEREQEQTVELDAVTPEPQLHIIPADQKELGLYLEVFFQELIRCGVTDFVVSPGSRSTGLAMAAYKIAGDVYIDVDERGAAFFALGLAKAKGNPVAVICTSGTAPANWMPAVLEARASKVPLLLLSADRPSRLQHLEAHQTTDQLELFGSQVKKFYQMPQPSADKRVLRYAQQIALDACIAAYGHMPGAQCCDGGPVHINFPFEEPLKPDWGEELNLELDYLQEGRNIPPTVVPGQVLLPKDARGIAGLISGKRTLVVCGEGSINSQADQETLIAFAQKSQLVLLADPLSGLRSSSEACVIDNYDTILKDPSTFIPEVIVRFGRWPVSKRLSTALEDSSALHIVVDMVSTRDATASTDMLIRTSPVAFAQAMRELPSPIVANEEYSQHWINANEEARHQIALVQDLPSKNDFEGAYVERLVHLAPEGSLLFSANSMAIRALDTFYLKNDKPLHLLCNRGLSGIDGTVSSALGAAQCFEQTTLLTGDLSFLHDLNALALHQEFLLREQRGAGQAPKIVIVVLNNGGGAIFDMLPQQSNEDYFQRLFLTPQKFSIKEIAQGFNIPYKRAMTVADFCRIYEMMLGQPGIGIIDIPLPLAGVKERYARFW